MSFEKLFRVKSKEKKEIDNQNPGHLNSIIDLSWRIVRPLILGHVSK